MHALAIRIVDWPKLYGCAGLGDNGGGEFFFFQAEDGIRDYKVTGVQTCALPIYRLRIQTIDAFCTALTRQLPVLARFGAQPEIVEDARELYFEAASRVFQQFNPASEKLLAHLDNDIPKATRLLADRLKDRDRWLRKTGEAPTRAELEATLASERNRLLARAKALYPRATEALARGYLTQKGEWTKRPAAPKELVSIPGLREALFALCNMPPAEYDDRQWEALEAILALLKPVVAHLKVLFGERGQADFTEFAHGALAALRSGDDPSDLLLSLGLKISHGLVDEFQDTSLDRKSTRLNSSHLVTSYAVFCLK